MGTKQVPVEHGAVKPVPWLSRLTASVGAVAC